MQQSKFCKLEQLREAMQGNQAMTQIHRRRLIHGAAASATALTVLTLLVTLLVGAIRN